MSPALKLATIATCAAIAWAAVYGMAKLGAVAGSALARAIGL